MRTIGIQLVLLSLASFSLAACGPFGPEPSSNLPEEAGYCATDFEDVFPETREVDLGLGPAGAFAPFRDGDKIDTITGGQGATMITPMVRVAKGAADAAEPCFRVRVEEGDAPYSSVWNIQFVQEGDHLFSDGVLYFITDTTGDVTLTLTVEGEGFSGTRSVDVTLR